MCSVAFHWACGAGQSNVPLPTSTAASRATDEKAEGQVPGGSLHAKATTSSEPTLISSGIGGYWLEGQVTEVTNARPDLRVDPATRHQVWRGFGGTFNEAGFEALSRLSASDRQRALALLFDARQGAHFVYGRAPIGASDFALQRYTLHETANDYTLASFSIERDRQRLIPYVKAALALAPDLHLWASPWTPPAWMKQNNSTDGGRIRDEPQILKAYALYLARFVEAYATEGITIGAIHPQNEPGFEQAYPSCLWTPELLRSFIGEYLGPTFAERGIGAEIWLGTMSAKDDVQHVAVVMADAQASRYVKGIGLQWNTMDAIPGFVSSYGLPVMQTEHKAGNYPWKKATFNASRAPNDHAYAEESWGLISGWIRAGANAYLAWNMVLDTLGLNLDVQRPWPQNSLLVVDRSAGTLEATPAYYVFRHLSQFVEPGARRIGTTGAGDALAFENPDGSIVTVLYNPADIAQPLVLGVRAALLQLTVPAHGWTTVTWP
jgi:glucosylceramidase